MKFTTLTVSAVLVVAGTVSAFQPQTQPRRVASLHMQSSFASTAIDVSETAQRDVYTMQSWAQQYGVQMAEGVEIGSNDGEDYSVFTNSNIPSGSPVMFVPSQLVMTSGSVEAEFGGSLQAAEQTLVEFEGTAQRLPLFRLMIKVLSEYEQGDQSPWYYYLNSMPRRFYNGAAMTGTYPHTIIDFGIVSAANTNLGETKSGSLTSFLFCLFTLVVCSFFLQQIPVSTACRRTRPTWRSTNVTHTQDSLTL